MPPNFCLDKIISSCKNTKNITIKYLSSTKIFEEEGEAEQIVRKESFDLNEYSVFADQTGLLVTNKGEERDSVFFTLSSILEISPQPEREEKKILRKKESVFEKLKR